MPHPVYTTVVFDENGYREKLNEQLTFCAAAGQHDYVRYDDELGVYAAEYKGRRPTQEDTLQICELDEFEQLSQAEQDKVIQQTINELQTEIALKQSEIEDGCCLLANIVLPTSNPDEYEILTISLGDSESLLATVDESDLTHPTVKITPLNKHHNLKNPEEKERLKGKFLIKDRLVSLANGATLAVTGALGDIEFEANGLTHIANISRTRVNSEKKQILITACDGLTEAMTYVQMHEAIKLLVNEPQKLADFLASSAIGCGSNDNVSTITKLLTDPKKLPDKEPSKPLKKPLLMAVFDGHNGQESARAAQHKFAAYLAMNAKALKNPAPDDDNLIPLYVNTLKSAFVSHLQPAHDFYSFIKAADIIVNKLIKINQPITPVDNALAFFKLSDQSKLLHQINVLKTAVQEGVQAYHAFFNATLTGFYLNMPNNNMNARRVFEDKCAKIHVLCNGVADNNLVKKHMGLNKEKVVRVKIK